MILALGEICEHENAVLNNDISTSNSDLDPISPPLTQHSPQSSSHSSVSSSPITDDASSNQYPPFTRNLDVIPGYAYFAIATDNLGGHAGGMNLPYIHAHPLARLYQNQLGRVLQSHAYVKEAGYALTIMLKQ